MSQCEERNPFQRGTGSYPRPAFSNTLVEIAVAAVAIGRVLKRSDCAALVLASLAAIVSFRPGFAVERNLPESDGLLETVVTSATKKSEAEVAQEVPAALSILSADDLATRHVTDVEDLSYAMPNVALDGIGTGKGIANFAIRGLGVAGSIPSIDPTVGVFVDGVYLGVNYGVIMDLLDIEAVETLRGPQGLLFGRNVTGGALLLRSRRPTGEASAEAAVRTETGPDRRLAFGVERPLGQTLDMRFAASYRDDAGWFENRAPGGGAVGAESTYVLRPVVTWTPSDRLSVTAIYERGDMDGDGPATQNRHRFNGFDFAIDEPGFSRVGWQHAIVEASRRVAFGEGRITNVFGWREVQHESLADIDSTPQPIFHLLARTAQDQISNELRYSGWLRGGWETTLGAYFFAQDIHYRERRVIRSAWGAPFGGEQDHMTGGIFMNNDLELGAAWVLTLGARYTFEKKDVSVATPGNSVCEPDTHRCQYDFLEGRSWRNVTPKIGLQRWLGRRTQLYGHYTKGFRSGGYNVRNTSPVARPGPFDEEEQDSFEAGIKWEFAERRARLNIAVFHNQIYGMQRQITRADVVSGGIQVTANTADATIKGIEADLVAALGDATTFTAFLGYTDGAYDRVRYDLNGDGSTLGDDKLRLPRLAELTYGAELRHARQLGTLGRLAVRVGLAHRDDSEIADDNRGVLDAGDLLGASVSFSPTEALTFTLYGRNLLGEVLRRSDLDLTGLVDSTYSPLKEGRVLGIEVRGSL